MQIWIIKEGELMPWITGHGRVMRSGLMAECFSKDEKNQVVWFASTFMHYEKEYVAKKNENIKIKDNFEIKLLHSNNNYKKNISFNRIKYCRSMAKALKQEMIKMEKPDVIICSWPLIELAYECIKFGKINNIPVAIDIRDFWPDTFTQPFNGLLKKIVGILVDLIYGRKTRFVMQNAEKIIGVVPKCLELSQKYGRTLRPCDETIYLAYKKNSNENSKKSIDDVLEKYGIDSNNFIVTYFGAINNRIDNMNLIIDTAKKIDNQNVKFVICGDGMAYSECVEESKDYKNLIFTGLLSQNEISAIASIAKIGLLPYRNTEDFKDALPNKFAEYISFGLPVLTSLDGLSSKLVGEKKCGSYFESVDDLIEKIEFYYKNEDAWKREHQNAIELYYDSFDSDKVYSKLLNSFEFIGGLNK